MRHLTAAETQCHLGLITLGQEANDVTQLDLVIVLIRTGTKLDLFDLDILLLALRGVRLLVLFEQEFAEVHHTDHRRIGLRRHLDEIELRAAREIERLESSEHSDLSAIGPDDSHLGRRDLFVAPYALACNSYKFNPLTTCGRGSRLPRGVD